MADPAQNPVANQTDPLRASLTNDTPPVPPTPEPPAAEPPAEPPLTPPAETTVPPAGEPYTTTPPPETTPPPQTPLPTTDVPTPPQESLPPTDQYQAAPWAQQQPAYSQQTPEDQTMPAAPPPVVPETPKSSSPKGFIIGGLLALIIVAAIFGAMTFLNKNSANDIPVPPSATNKTASPKPVTPQQTTAPLTTTAPSVTAAPTPKTSETFTNTTYKYKFEYPLGLAAPAKIAPDTTRFPKALETVKLNLSSDPAASLAAYFTVWAKVEDVPKYITDGQSQFVKVNQYTTNRFTVKKTSGAEETHYLTQKFNNTYDLMLESPSGRISDPVFEKILNSFTFLESATSPTATPAKTSSPSASPKL